MYCGNTVPDEQPSFIQNDQELLEAARSIDPKVLSHFRLLEQPYRGGPDFRYLFTTDQVQEVLIQSVQLSISRTGPFTLTGPYGTGKSTIITHGSVIFISPLKSIGCNDLMTDFGKPRSNDFNRLEGKWANRRS